jgi:cyanophycin synthetase
VAAWAVSDVIIEKDRDPATRGVDLQPSFRASVQDRGTTVAVSCPPWHIPRCGALITGSSMHIDPRLELRSLRILRAHNRHAYVPVIEATIAIGRFEEIASDEVPGLVERLAAWFPGLAGHRCSVGRPGGFLERLRRGTYLPHIWEHVSIDLQNRMGFDVGFGRARGTGEPGVYRVVVEQVEAEPALAALETALRLVLAAFDGRDPDVAEELRCLEESAERYRFGPSTAAIVRAAAAHGIPVIRLTPCGGLVQLGYGVHQRRIRAAQTSQTSSIAVEICQEKPLTNRLLRAIGVPVPQGRRVVSADDAWAAAQELGLPAVVKPEDGNQGNGVSVDLTSEAEVRAAYERARAAGSGVLVERCLRGNDYRLLVVGGALVAAARRDPPSVIGDGVRSVHRLVEVVNADPRRRPGHGSDLSPVPLDETAREVLEQQGLAPDDVPAAGRRVVLRRNGNLSTGGTAEDVTDRVHPGNARIAELAAQFLGLDIAGIDVVCQDIGVPMAEDGGAIVEVNAAPGLRMHLHPSAGRPRDVGSAIIGTLFPQPVHARIPVVAVTGTNGKTTVTRLISHILAVAHQVVGMTTTDGIYIGDERIVSGDCSGPASAETVLMHPRVEAAVLETARGGILREGLGFAGCDVGVVTNVSDDHLGLGGVASLEELAAIKQVVVQAVRRAGTAVLNADDRLVAEMAAATAERVVYFSRDAHGPVVSAHLAAGGCCVVADRGVITVLTGSSRNDLVELARVGFTHGGHIDFAVENALAAAAAAWSVGINPALIVRGLTSFATTPEAVPGRFNRREIGGREVVVDYAHNRAAMRALGQATAALGSRRTIMALALPGDRRDQDLIATGTEAAAFCATLVLYDLGDLRGRAPGAVPALLAAHLAGACAVETVADQGHALDRAWAVSRAGDRLILIADDVDEAIRLVHGLDRHDACCGTAPPGHGDTQAVAIAAMGKAS